MPEGRLRLHEIDNSLIFTNGLGGFNAQNRYANLGWRTGRKACNPIAGVRRTMTMDKSLKVQAGAIKSRNVLNRAERIAKLQESNRWSESSKVLGMPKVRVVKVSLKKKKKVKTEEVADTKKKK